MSNFRNFSYKYRNSTSFMYENEKQLKFAIPLWKISRLTLIRCTIFLECFFNGTYIKLNTVRFKNKLKKYYLLFTFPIHNNLSFLALIAYFLTQPYCLGSNHGFVLIISFNSFFMFVPNQFKHEKLFHAMVSTLKFHCSLLEENIAI
jgi:hypothetical protein